MQVRKAVITAAAVNQNRLPLQQIVDAGGEEKTALQLIVEETVAAGIEEICVVIQPGDSDAYRSAAGPHLGSLSFVPQASPDGYANAIAQAASFVGDDPFLHLVGDHLYVSASDTPCAKQLIQVATEFDCSVSAVQSTRENNLPYFGVVSGPHVPQKNGVYEIERVIEKPTPTEAEQELVTPGLRAGHYLGFFGIHVLTPEVMPVIEQLCKDRPQEKPSLSDALAMLPPRGRYLASKLQGSRYNLGIKYGLLKAQLAIGLSGKDRDMILTELVELLSHRLEGSAIG